MADALLRFDLPLDLTLLEQVVSSLYAATSPEQVQARRGAADARWQHVEHRESSACTPRPRLAAARLMPAADSGSAADTVAAARAHLGRRGLERAELVSCGYDS